MFNFARHPVLAPSCSTLPARTQAVARIVWIELGRRLAVGHPLFTLYHVTSCVDRLRPIVHGLDLSVNVFGV